uniref:Centrosomal protein of 131 kDa n=1 Tax=Cacopsylla melanoneura TaxID=428564 RepID=A0A8D9BVW1_9HEMI
MSDGDDNTGMETSDNSAREQTHAMMYRRHQDELPNDGKETSMKTEDQLIENHNGNKKIGYERRSVQQNMRYAANREQFDENQRRHNEPGQGLKEHKERVGERLNDQPIPHNDAEGSSFDTRDVDRYRFEEQHNAYNQFERVHGVKYQDQDQTDDGIGATSKEYYVEYRDGKSYENNQEEVTYRYDELHNSGRYGTRHYTGQYTWDNENEESCGPHCKEQSRRNINEREYRYENPRENARKCEAHDRKYQYYQGTKDGDTDQCDSCKKDQSMNSDRNEKQKYDREIYLKEKENAGSAQNYQNKTLEQNYETNQTESDSAVSEDKNHYINSMDVLDKIYTSKRKSGTKYEREERFKNNSAEVTNEPRNESLHKNGRRKSMENVNPRLTKSHSEEMYVYWNDEHKTKYVGNRSDQNGVHANEKQSRVNGDIHLRTETPERHYLDRYNFEEEEKILNHILEKSKHGQRSERIPEIKVNDESMLEEYPVKDINSSTYNEIVDILKVLEKEEKGLKTDHDPMQYTKPDSHNYNKNKVMSLNGTGNNLEFVNQDRTTKTNLIQSKPSQPHNNTHQNEVEPPTEPIHVGDIYSFLDKVDNEVNQNETTLKSDTLGCTSKLSELMKLSSADLAQKYLTLSINMDEKQIIITALEKRIEQIDKHCKEMKTDTDATVKRLQKFIAQLIKEKKDLGEQCSEMCKDMEKKYKQIIDTLDERHKIEIKKNTEKHLAAEKIRREKWIDNKTQKIKELTVKGLEPELLKMTTAHQEEIAEMRKAHNRQLEENDAMWNRKISTMKEKFEEDLQNAILQEKENGRKRLDEELKTVESNYQEQRKHLLNEIRIERENLDRQAEDMRNEKEKELNQKLEKLIKQNKESCEKMENKHQDELRKVREDLNQEKQMWVKNKTAQMEEKEQLIREQCKRERDKHIELIIQKLEKEQTERNTAADMKLKNIKEQHDKEIEEMESTLVNVKTKLNETRSKLQNTEDLVTELKSQVHTYQIETKNQGELLDKLKTENHDMKLKSEHETNDKINRLEEEIEQTRNYFETLISRMKKDQERELSQVYGRVKETIGKKDEAIAILTQQKEAALTQCANLETIIAQRKH